MRQDYRKSIGNYRESKQTPNQDHGSPSDDIQPNNLIMADGGPNAWTMRGSSANWHGDLQRTPTMPPKAVSTQGNRARLRVKSPVLLDTFFFSPGHCARKHTMENETDSIGRCFVESFVSSRAQPTPPSLTFQFSIGNHHVGIPAVDLSSHMVIHFCSFNMRISNRPGVHELDNRITTLPCDF